MIRKIKYSIAILVGLIGFSLPGVVSASCSGNNIATNVYQGVSDATGSTSTCSTSNNIQSGVKSVATNVVNILSIVVGVVAIIMIIIGGFRYITSGGESGNVSGAKNTLLFAIVGLVIVALAQIIVHWVLGSASSISGFIR